MDYLDARRCIDCNDDVRTKEAFWGCEICGLNTCEECCENDDGHVLCAGCVENMTTKNSTQNECEICGDECVDYDDKLCHGCYHKSVGADECWCASAVKKPKKKKKRKRLVIVDKLCKSTPCQLIKDEEWNMKCSMCDGYYKDDGLHDILDVNDDENRSCKLCGNSDNVVIMKGTGSCFCAKGCDDDEEDVDVCERCGEEIDDDNLSDNIDGHLCVECDREENGGTLFAESNPNGLLRCKNCKKNDNFFAMDDPELCVPCVDLLHYSLN